MPRTGRVENLKPWPKGVSGNKQGRPKTKIIRDYVRKIIEEKDPKTQKAIAEQCAEALIKFAKRGSLGHLQAVLNLTESDSPGAGSEGNKLDSDSVAKLIDKLCR